VGFCDLQSVGTILAYVLEILKEASMKRILFLILIVSLFGTMAFANGGSDTAAADDTIVVGVSFSDYSTDRWPREAALLTDLGQKAGVQVITQVANQDPKLQNDQIENMILQGADVLIIIAQDGDAAASAVDAAAAEGIPTIAYDRLIKSANLSAYLSFDNVEVGRAQGRGVTSVVDSGNFVMLGGSPTDNNATLFRQGQMEVVQPLVDAGKVTIVADQWVENWDPANALKNMENILTAQSNNVDAIVASNDGTALGALQAMKAQGLAGKVPISGQDATLAELTLNDALKGSVPCLFLEVVQVDADNLYDEVILTGFQPYDEVYRDIPEDQRPPRP